MKILGLTGSIGMGKSLVASMLRRRRVPVFDSDRCVHHLLGPNGKACAAVAKAFPAAWDKKKHLINRQKLGDMIFHAPHQRRKLEAILHPLVAQAQKEFIAKARRTGIKTIVLDIPLLFETNGQRKCDAVICVTAPSFIQRIRVL
ncbi:MAG: dephospho-CoA kinase, partial [Pseudomonadota bacterium]